MPAPKHAAADSFGTYRPIGFRVDIGAPSSVVGTYELSRLMRHLGRRCDRLETSRNSFRFAEPAYHSKGTVVLPLRTPLHAKNIQGESDVVDENVPALLGLDTMETHYIMPCILTN